MKLKDLIGIIPDEETVYINDEECYAEFCDVSFSSLKKEVISIKGADWGGINIEICD